MNLNISLMQKRYITEALIRTNNSKQKASKLLGITTRTLLRKRDQYNIELKVN